MKTFLGSNLLKNGVSWRGFKGSLIFAFGFYTNYALTPNLKTLLKEATESLDEAKSLTEDCVAHVDKLKEKQKTMIHLMQLYNARTAELKELKKSRWGKRVVDRRQNLCGVSYEENGSEEETI